MALVLAMALTPHPAGVSALAFYKIGWPFIGRSAEICGCGWEALFLLVFFQLCSPLVYLRCVLQSSQLMGKQFIVGRFKQIETTAIAVLGAVRV
jgi:hypothetical protein